MNQVTLKVNGMSCGHCAASIEKALKAVGAAGEVDLQNGTVAVRFDESKVTLDAVKAAIEDQGYDVV